MNQKLLEQLGAFTFLILGVVIILGALVFLAHFAFLTFPLMILILILGVLSLVTGITMWGDSRE